MVAYKLDRSESGQLLTLYCKDAMSIYRALDTLARERGKEFLKSVKLTQIVIV